jgi:hypothetical protein
VAVIPLEPPTARPVPVMAARDRNAASVTTIDDVTEAAVALVAVGTALLRYLAERGAAARREVLPRRPSVRRALAGVAGQVLAHPLAAAIRTASVVADHVVPAAASAVLSRLDVPALVREFVDVDRLAELLDVDAVVARVNLDRAVDRVDIARVLDRVDLDAVVARVNLDRAVDRVDIARVLDRVDVDEVVAKVDFDRAVDRVDIARVLDRVDVDDVVAKVDLDRAVDRVDIARVLDRVDVDDVVAKVDLDRAVDRVDVDRVIARTDIAGLARYIVDVIDLPGLVRASTGSVTSEVVRGVRDQGADADRAVERVVDRLLHRHTRRTGPPPDPEQPGADT